MESELSPNMDENESEFLQPQCDEDTIYESEEYSLSQYTPDMDTACDEKVDTTSHTVTFKCIGASKSVDSQEILKKVCELLANGIDVPVDVYPEPENPYDSRAIAFKAYVGSKLHTIGYVVREATEYVHNEMGKKHY